MKSSATHVHLNKNDHLEIPSPTGQLGMWQLESNKDEQLKRISPIYWLMLIGIIAMLMSCSK